MIYSYSLIRSFVPPSFIAAAAVVTVFIFSSGLNASSTGSDDSRLSLFDNNDNNDPSSLTFSNDDDDYPSVVSSPNLNFDEPSLFSTIPITSMTDSHDPLNSLDLASNTDAP